MNPVHTLLVHSGGLRANVFVSNDKIPFLVLLYVGDYLVRFVHAVQWILFGIHEFFGSRLKSGFSIIINTLTTQTYMPKGHGTVYWYFKEVLFHLPVY